MRQISKTQIIDMPTKVSCFANDVFDENLQMYQSEINRLGPVLCNIPEVNDFVADIVLKDGVEIDFANSTGVNLQCGIFNSGLNRYQHRIGVTIGGESVEVFYKAYDTLEDARADFGKLLESPRAYVVLRDLGSDRAIVNKTLSFNRDISWSSLNEHPVIKGLMIEQGLGWKTDYSYGTINGYNNKTTDEHLTIGMYWNCANHKRYSAQGLVSNDVSSCRGGDVFTITGTGSSGWSRLYVFADVNGNNIEGYVAEAGEVRENYSIVAPDNAVSFYFSAFSSHPYKLQKQSSYEGILNELSGIRIDLSKLSSSTANGEAAYEELYGEGQNADAISLEDGYYWYVKNTPPTKGQVNGWSCNPSESVPCEPGDMFILTGEGGLDAVGGPNSYLWAFANSNGVITRHAEVSEKHITPFEVVAQEGEVQFYMSSYSWRKPTLFKKTVTEGLVKRVGDIETAVSAISDDITEIQEKIGVSKMFNVPVNLKKPSLKVLDLGNSFTGDATHYLADLLTTAGITTGFSLYDCIRGGSSFRSWVNLYKETDDAEYGVSKKAGDTISGIIGGFSGLDNSWFVNLLKQEWDIILIHQASIYSTRYDEWAGDGEAGGLTEYLRILRAYCPQAAIGFYIVHSYPSWRTGTLQGGTNSTERWQSIVKAVEHLKSDYGIDFIIPYGTAVQNLRLTSLNTTDPVDSTKKNDFSFDGTHLTSGIGDYVAACAYFEALFAPRYDVTVLGNSYTNTSIHVPQSGDADYYQGRGIPVQITAANALLAQRAAILAVNDMFNLSNPEVEGFTPVNTDTTHVYDGDGNPNASYSKAEVDARAFIIEPNSDPASLFEEDSSE